MTKQSRKGILPFILNGVVFIDLTKAFDTIDHENILRKTFYLGVDQAAIYKVVLFVLKWPNPKM